MAVEFDLILSTLFFSTLLLHFPATNSDDTCPYPIYPPPIGTGTPSTPATTTPPTQGYYSPPKGYLPYYPPPPPFEGNYYGGTPPDPILPYYPYYYKEPLHGQSSAPARYEPQPAPPYARNPRVFPPPTRTSTPWSTGLCDFHGCSLWCLTCILPCLTFGRVAEIVDEGSMSCATHAALYAVVNYLTGCVCVYSGYYREKIRQRYGLEEKPCNDYCTHCCCHRCALRQEYRELELRGFDLSVGWNGNIQRKIREAELVQAAPTMQAGMHRQV